MKKNVIQKIITVFSIAIFFSSCVTDNNETTNFNTALGVLPEITAGSNSTYDLLNPDVSAVDFSISPIENNTSALSGEVHVNVNELEYVKLNDVSSFPSQVSYTLTEILNTLNLTTSDVTGGDIVNFRTFFTTSEGNLITSSVLHSASILCPPIPGTYNIQMQDSYGDGWQGGGINAIVDGNPTFFTMQSSYDGGPACCSWKSTTDTFIVQEGAASLVWEYVDDSYNSEVSFQIYDPNGLLINDSSNPSGGVLIVPSTCPN